MASAWETISNNRRRKSRYKVSLKASISLVEKESKESQWTTVLARTRDISREGLCLIMPSADMGCHHLGEGNYVVRIMLVLPTEANIKLEGQLVYCLPFKASEYAGYLVGVKITELSVGDRIIFNELIDSLH